MLYRSHLTIFSIDNQHEKGSKKNAMGWSTTAYFPNKKAPNSLKVKGFFVDFKGGIHTTQ
jgi:hypothetical protein